MIYNKGLQSFSHFYVLNINNVKVHISSSAWSQIGCRPRRRRTERQVVAKKKLKGRSCERKLSSFIPYWLGEPPRACIKPIPPWWLMCPDASHDTTRLNIGYCYWWLDSLLGTCDWAVYSWLGLWTLDFWLDIRY